MAASKLPQNSQQYGISIGGKELETITSSSGMYRGGSKLHKMFVQTGQQLSPVMSYKSGRFLWIFILFQ